MKLEAVGSIVFKRLNVEYVVDGRSRYFVLDEMTGEGAAEKPVVLTLRGSVENSFPYTIKDRRRATVGSQFRCCALAFQAASGIRRHCARNERRHQGPAGDAAVDVTFGLGTQDLAELERLLQTQLPPVGATGLSGHVEWSNGRLRVSNLNGVMGGTTLQGDLGLDLTASQPRVTGDLTLPVLDLRPFLNGQPEPAMPRSHRSRPISQSLRRRPREPSRNSRSSGYSLTELQLVDADLTLQVGKWIGVPGDVRDSQLRLLLQNGQLNAPMKATVADVPAGRRHRRRCHSRDTGLRSLARHRALEAGPAGGGVRRDARCRRERSAASGCA